MSVITAISSSSNQAHNSSWDPSDLQANRRAAFKSYLIKEFCEERADSEIIEAFFEVLPELKDA
jgi:hypothetical protein